MKKLFAAIFLILALILVSCGESEEKTEKLQESSINMSTTETAVMGLLDDTILYSENSDNKLDRDYFEYYFGIKYLFSFNYKSTIVGIFGVGKSRLYAGIAFYQYIIASLHQYHYSLWGKSYSLFGVAYFYRNANGVALSFANAWREFF